MERLKRVLIVFCEDAADDFLNRIYRETSINLRDTINLRNVEDIREFISIYSGYEEDICLNCLNLGSSYLDSLLSFIENYEGDIFLIVKDSNISEAIMSRFMVSYFIGLNFNISPSKFSFLPFINKNVFSNLLKIGA